MGYFSFSHIFPGHEMFEFKNVKFPQTTSGIHKVSFPLVPQLVNHLLHVRDRVMMMHDACTSETSQVLTVASLQRLKMEALIPAPADCGVRFLISF